MAEIVIYHHLYNKKSGTFLVSQSVGELPSSKKQPRSVASVFLRLSRITAMAGIALIIFFYAPTAFAWGTATLSKLDANFKISTAEVQNIRDNKNTVKPNYTPPIDPMLSTVNKLVIYSIGVNTGIEEATLDNYESALKKGVWRVSDFGAPTDRSEPIILAAHRFGYLAWTNLYRHENSFFNLPKVKVGDTIEIDWQQRKYTYEVYETDKGTEITDYSADLILYTCESLTGPERYFVYAKLITT